MSNFNSMEEYFINTESKDLEENKIGNYCVSLDEISKKVKRNAASLRKAKIYRSRGFDAVNYWDKKIKESKELMKKDLILISELEVA